MFINFNDTNQKLQVRDFHHYCNTVFVQNKYVYCLCYDYLLKTIEDLPIDHNKSFFLINWSISKNNYNPIIKQILLFLQ